MINNSLHPTINFGENSIHEKTTVDQLPGMGI